MTEPTVDVRPLLDPKIAELLGAFPIQLGELSDDRLGEVRAGMAAMPSPPLSGTVDLVDHEVPDSGGVVVRVYTPQGEAKVRPCVYWMHGGGLILGSYTMDDARFDDWCQRFDIVGVSVEYRLAPETPYPGPIEDCYAGLRWVHDHADELGIDNTKVGIGGVSAGGGLAAALALLARDRGGPGVAFQMLIYPMLDDRQITPSSGWIDPIWPPSANHYGWTAYLGAAKGTTDVPIYAAPARATDLAGLPPTLVTVGAIDGFSDEDIDYALRLRHAGVPTELHVYPGGPHGFDMMRTVPIADRAVRDMEEWLVARLAD